MDMKVGESHATTSTYYHACSYQTLVNICGC